MNGMVAFEHAQQEHRVLLWSQTAAESNDRSVFGDPQLFAEPFPDCGVVGEPRTVYAVTNPRIGLIGEHEVRSQVRTCEIMGGISVDVFGDGPAPHVPQQCSQRVFMMLVFLDVVGMQNTQADTRALRVLQRQRIGEVRMHVHAHDLRMLPEELRQTRT